MPDVSLLSTIGTLLSLVKRRYFLSLSDEETAALIYAVNQLEIIRNNQRLWQAHEETKSADRLEG